MKKGMLKFAFVFTVVAAVTMVAVVYLAANYYGWDWRLVPNGLIFAVVISLAILTYHRLFRRGEGGDNFLSVFFLSVIFLKVVGLETIYRDLVIFYSLVLVSLGAGFSIFYQQCRADKIDLILLGGRTFYVSWAITLSWLAVAIIESNFIDLPREKLIHVGFVFAIIFSYPLIIFVFAFVCLKGTKLMSGLFRRAFVTK